MGNHGGREREGEREKESERERGGGGKGGSGRGRERTALLRTECKQVNCKNMILVTLALALGWMAATFVLTLMNW